MTVVRPLRHRLFSAVGIPMHTRRQLLRSLAMSRYSCGSAALQLSSGLHKRLWAKHYVNVALWRSLWRRGKGEHYRHCYAASGPCPRAVLLRQLTANGPATLLQLLFVHWHECPKQSWLHQVVGDITHVSQYVTAARTLLSTGDPITFLIEALRDNACWWVLYSLRLLVGARSKIWTHGMMGAVPQSLARTSVRTSTVGRHQQHLKTSSPCMLRTCLLVPCLSVDAPTRCLDFVLCSPSGCPCPWPPTADLA